MSASRSQRCFGCSYRTYEGLKHEMVAEGTIRKTGSYRTYEGLKRGVEQALLQGEGARSYRTYEGLKRVPEARLDLHKPGSYRTYEGLKRFRELPRHLLYRRAFVPYL